MENKYKNHPSFGQLSFHRISSGGGKSLYGSSLQHSEIIRMRLSSSESQRDLNHTSYYTKKTLFEVDMSPQQFAELVTTMNRGDGTPVTIVRTPEGDVEGCPFENEREIFSKEFRSDLDQITKNSRVMISRAKKMLSQKTIKKSEMKELIGYLESINRDLSSNLGFVETMFQEATDKAVSAGKHEIESFWQSTIEKLGVQKLAENVEAPKLLMDNKPEENDE
jgi:hypothetical protein